MLHFKTYLKQLSLEEQLISSCFGTVECRTKRSVFYLDYLVVLKIKLCF